MKVLYLSEGESLGIFDIDDLLDNLVAAGTRPEILKEIASNLDAQGFFITSWGDFGSYAIIKLNLPHHTITVTPNTVVEKPTFKPAFKGAKKYSHK